MAKSLIFFELAFYFRQYRLANSVRLIGESTMNIQQIQEARELYGIDNWGSGYFNINDHGNVTCHPTAEDHRGIDIMQIIQKVKNMGASAPMILRFPQIIDNQIMKLLHAFRDAIWEYSYTGRHLGVFPFKVNQRREFIDSIVSAGQRQNYGLEVGSKTEMLAALSYDLSPESLLICNGFKDEEFIDLGFIGKRMGKNVVMVVEGPDELQMITKLAKKDPQNCPKLGLRIKLYTKGSGKWAKSSGETSKFGLTTVEVIDCLKIAQDAGLSEKLAMLHFHIGSQVTEIKRIKKAIKEAARVYAKIHKMGYTPEYLNIGGGVGVDYDGSKTSFQSSANYSIQEFANDVVYEIGEVCNNEEVKSPIIVSESGRIIAAYHSVVVTDIREVQGSEAIKEESEYNGEDDSDSTKMHKSLEELKYILNNLNRKNFVEYYHDAIEYHEEMFTLFNLGYIDLKERATAEELFSKICRRALHFSSFDKHRLEEFDDLQSKRVSKYLANFSIFQSIPDAWSIDQLFPVMPLSRHEQKPSEKATIVDITCDSDGCLEQFVDRRDIKNVLDLHHPSEEDYFLGFFLVGAYQESLANEHNLFGAINEAEIILSQNGSWDVIKVTKGDPMDELLTSRNYNIEEMHHSYEKQLNKYSQETKEENMSKLMKSLSSTPYLNKT